MITNLNFTHIGKEADLKGELIFKNATRIAGNITGNIIMENNSKLTLEIGSRTVGNINGQDIEIYGTLEGEIIATGNVVIFPTGVVEGKIIAKGLEVYPGANLNIIGHTQE